MLNLGTNFAPEHLEEMFEEPRSGIRRIELRFRPYVEQASYYQFLAGESTNSAMCSKSHAHVSGSYFDTSVETMYRRWPETPSFTHLSIIQDPPPRMTAPPTARNSRAATVANSGAATAESSLANSVADLTLESSDSESTSENSTPATSAASQSSVEKGYTGHGPFPYLNDKMGWAKPKSFAQPIVFFDIKCLARFGAASVAANLTHLRLRVPSRDIAYVLIGPQVPGRTSNLFPSLRYLDISTTNVRLDSVLSTLLRSYERLEHLVLDRVNLFGFTAKDRGVELCRELGGLCVSAGLARGKERERAIAAWDVMERTRFAQAEAERQRLQAEQTHVEEGRGLSPEIVAARNAQAEAEERERLIALSRSRRGHRSAAHSTISLRDRPSRVSRVGAATSTLPSNIALPPPDRAYFVLPPLPTLKTVSIGGEAHAISTAKIAEWEDDFHSGWRDGLGKVLGWAVHVAEKYERAKKKADEWYNTEMVGGKAKEKPARGKGKSAAPAAKVKPPTDIRLFRFPLPSEPRVPGDPSDPTSGLIEIHPIGREYIEDYRNAIGDAELYAASHGNPPPCVLCTVPDCEGPARKGSEGERVDGRGGLNGKHKDNCGHLYGRNVWGWQNVEHL